MDSEADSLRALWHAYEVATEDCLVEYVSMPYGNPGVESLNCGLPPLHAPSNRVYSNTASPYLRPGSESHEGAVRDSFMKTIEMNTMQNSLYETFNDWDNGHFTEPQPSMKFGWRELEYEMNPYDLQNGWKALWKDELNFEHLNSLHAFSSPLSESPDAKRTISSKATSITKPTNKNKKRRLRSDRTARVNMKSGQSQRGMTMCLRVLLRQLLAGSGWIMNTAIKKQDALELIQQLIGTDISAKVVLEDNSEDQEQRPIGWRELFYGNRLADILSLYLHRTVTRAQANEFLPRTPHKGGYRPSDAFLDALDGRSWPPYLPSDAVMRSFGCYRGDNHKTDLTKRSRSSKFDKTLPFGFAYHYDPSPRQEQRRHLFHQDH